MISTGTCDGDSGPCYTNPYKLINAQSPPPNPPTPPAPSPPPQTNNPDRKRRRRLQQDFNNNNNNNNNNGNTGACEDVSYYANYEWQSLEIVFIQKDSSIDLFTAEAFEEICKVEENIMADGTNWKNYCKGATYPYIAENCYVEDTSSSSTFVEDRAPSYFTKTYTNASGTQFYARGCYNANSYAQMIKSSLQLSSCAEFRTNALVATVVGKLKTAVLACVDVLQQDANAQCATLTMSDLGIDGSLSTQTFSQNQYYVEAFLGTEFSNASPKLGKTRSVLPMDWSRTSQDSSQDYIISLGGLLQVSNEYFETVYGNDELVDYVTNIKLYEDMILASFAVVIILILILANTGSVFLTFAGIAQILLSFPLATFFLNTVCGIKFFPFLNFIGIFVICGIGADDCFVYLAKWDQAKVRLPPNAPAKEISRECYWDAAYAMLLTSVTTAAAFFSTAGSMITPIRVFAIFMGSMVVFDYILDITIFAACVAWQHDKIITLREKRDGGSKMSGYVLRIFFEMFPSDSRYRTGCCWKIETTPTTTSPTVADEEGEVKNTQQAALVSETISRDYIFPVIHKLRFFLVLAAIGLGAGSAYGGSMLSLPTDSAVELLPADHVLTQYSRITRSGFKSATESRIEVDVVFGLKAEDDGDWNDPASVPSFAIDDTFDMSSEEAQLWLYKFCENGKALAYGNETRCWLDQFSNWLTDMNSAWASNWTDPTYRQLRNTGEGPLALGDFSSQHETGAWAWKRSCASTAALPIPQSQFIGCVFGWTYDTQSMYSGGNYYLKNSKTVRNTFYNVKTANGIVTETYDSIKMLLTSVSFTLDIGWDEETSLLKDRWTKWESFIDEQLVTAPAGLKNGWQTDRGAWRWFDTVENMNKNFREAVIMCLNIALCIALISTSNIIVTALTTFSIGSILAATISIVVSLGWTLGFLEGICLCILIGLSVDFVIHIGHAYNDAGKRGLHSRYDRTREAFARMAFPIASAAFTTFASACVLFFCTITFFQKFGTIVMISMICAINVSLLFYVSLLATIGPQGSFGDISVCFKSKSTKKRAEEGDSTSSVVE